MLTLWLASFEIRNDPFSKCMEVNAFIPNFDFKQFLNARKSANPIFFHIYYWNFHISAKTPILQFVTFTNKSNRIRAKYNFKLKNIVLNRSGRFVVNDITHINNFIPSSNDDYTARNTSIRSKNRYQIFPG